jgi:hypothetical protein
MVAPFSQDGNEKEAQGDSEVSRRNDPSREGYPISEGEGGAKVVQAVFPVKEEVPVGGESRPIQGHGIHGHSPVKENGRGVEESAQEERVHAPKVKVKGHP